MTNANGEAVFTGGLQRDLMPFDAVVESTHCPLDGVFAVDASEVHIGMGNIEFDTSPDATLVMADDDGVALTMAETNAVTVAASINVSDAGGIAPQTAVVGLFQQYGTALRSVL